MNEINYKKITKHGSVLRNIHPDINPIVSLILMMKIDFTNNIIFYIFSYFLRFVGVYIRCGNFSITQKQVLINKTSTKVIRNFTAYNVAKMMSLKNEQYNIICIAIIVIFTIRHYFYYLSIRNIINRVDIEYIKPYKIQVILDHIVFFFYAPLLEFFALIYYIVLVENFPIKEDKDCRAFNIILCIINPIMIVLYNIDGYIHSLAANKPFDLHPEINVSVVKYTYGKFESWIILFMNNLIIIESIALFLSGNVLTVFKYFFFVFFVLLFVIIFISSYNRYNYPVFLNVYVEFLAGFCFFSLVIELVLCLLDYNITTNLKMVLMTLGKIMLSLLFKNISNTFSLKAIRKSCKAELFKVNKEIKNNKSFECFKYLFEMMMNLIHSKSVDDMTQIMRVVMAHQEECKNLSCKCNLLKILKYNNKKENIKYKEIDNNSEDDMFNDLENKTLLINKNETDSQNSEKKDKNIYKEQEFIKTFIDRICFFVESSFVQIDYTLNFDLTILIANHLCYFRKNPLLGYCMIQTMLRFNKSKLRFDQIIQCYEACDIYFEYYNLIQQKKILSFSTSEKAKKVLFEEDKSKIKFGELFYIINEVKKLRVLFVNYTKIQIGFMKDKQNVEESAKLSFYEDSHELKSISFGFFTGENLKKIIKILRKETTLHHKIIHFLKNLNNLPNLKNIPLDFHYKCLLFADLFWQGIIPDNLIAIFYNFTTDRNLYTKNIQNKVFEILKERYIDENLQDSSTFTGIFKFSNTMKISYLTGALLNRLRYTHSEIVGENLSIIFPRDIGELHNSQMLKYLLTDKNRSLLHAPVYIFNKNMHCLRCIVSGIVLPSISKNLMVIFKLILNEKSDKYDFLMNKNYDVISVSDNYYKNYGLSLFLINKYKINLRELMGCNDQFMHKKFGKCLKKVEEIKNILSIFTVEYFTKRTFCNPNLIKNYLRHYKLMQNLEKKIIGDEKDNILTDIDLLKNIKITRKNLETLYDRNFNYKLLIHKVSCTISKIGFIQNFENLFDTMDELDIHDKDYYSINDALQRLIENKSTCADDDFFDIQITMKMLYDTPYFIVDITEINTSFPFYKGSVLKDSCAYDNELSELSSPNNKRSTLHMLRKSTDNKTIRLRPSVVSSLSGSSSITKRQAAMYKKNKYLLSKKVTISNNSLTNTSEVLEKINSIQEKNQISMIKFVNYITAFLSLISIVIYIFLITYQDNMLRRYHLIFDILFNNYYQRDKARMLYTVFHTSFLHIQNITKYEEFAPTNHVFNCLLNLYSTHYLIGYSRLYNAYNAVARVSSLDQDFFYQKLNFTKMTLYFEENSFMGDYLTEAKYISYMTKSGNIPEESAFNFNTKMEDQKKDVYNYFAFFHGQFSEKDKIIINDDYIKIYYYFCKNYSPVIFVFCTKLQSKIQEEFNNYMKSTRLCSIVLEMITCICIFILAAFLINFMKDVNNKLFKNILYLFIDFTQEGNYTFKNRATNYFVIKKLTEFNKLITDFSLKNLEDYDHKLRDDDIEDSDLSALEDLLKNSDDKDDSDEHYLRKLEMKKHLRMEKSFETRNNNLKNYLSPEKKHLIRMATTLRKSVNDDSFMNDSKSGLIKSSNCNIMNAANIKKISNKQGAESEFDSKKNEKILSKNLKKSPKKTPDANAAKDSEDIITPDLIIKRSKFKGINIIFKLIRTTIILSIVAIGFVVIKLIITISYSTQYEQVFYDFDGVTNEISYMYYFFNVLLTVIISPRLGLRTTMDNMIATITEKNHEFNKIDFSKYKILNTFYSKISEENEHLAMKNQIDLICDGKIYFDDKDQEEVLRQKCREVVNSDRNLLKNGKNDLKNAIHQSVSNMYNEFKVIGEQHNLQEISSFQNKNFRDLDIMLNYVVSFMQEISYQSFQNDEEIIQETFVRNVALLNVVAIIFAILIGIYVTVIALRIVESLAKLIDESTKRINKSFYKIKEDYIRSNNN